jgi:hypothetical protein
MVNSGFPYPGEVDRYINQGITELAELLIKSGQDYKLTSAIVSTINGTDTYLLPFDFVAIKGVDIQIGGQQQFDGVRFNWADRNKYKLIGNGWFYDQPVYYDLRDNNIVFMPAPQGSYVVSVWYFAVPQTLSEPDDVIDCVLGWEELITCSAAIKLLEREESFDKAARLDAAFAKVKERVQAMAPKRNAGEPPRVSRTRSRIRSVYGRRGL